MKKAMVVAVVAAVCVVGCATSGKLFDAAHVAAQAGPAVIEDARSLSDKIGDVWQQIRQLWAPSTNAPIVAK